MAAKKQATSKYKPRFDNRHVRLKTGERMVRTFSDGQIRSGKGERHMPRPWRCSVRKKSRSWLISMMVSEQIRSQ